MTPMRSQNVSARIKLFFLFKGPRYYNGYKWTKFMLKYCKLTKKPMKPNLTRPICLVALNELALPLKLSLLPARPIILIFWPQACLPSYQFQIKSCSVAKRYQWLSFWIQVSIVWMAFWRDWTWREMNEGVSSHQLLRAQVERWHEQFSIWFLWEHLRTG